MRPLLLHLQNIGPFRSETVNFDRLGDIFLVCGKTGAGKSTIFNAITYAIYGRLPGSHSGVKGSQIRSDFASPQEDAIITLTFMLHHRCYRVQRILPRTYTNRKGAESTSSEDIQLHRKEGSDFVLMSNKKAEADEMLNRLMGLTVEEFARIILLPQGEFAEFLRQKSSERRETLLKLFPITDYEELAQRIKDKNEEEKFRVQELERQLAAFGDFDLQQEEQRLAEYEATLEGTQQKKEELTELRTRMERELDSRQRLKSDFLRHQDLSSQLEVLVGKEAAVRERRRRIELAQRAAPTYIKVQNLEKSRSALQEALRQLAATSNKIQDLERIQGELQEQAPRFSQMQVDYERNIGLQQLLRRALVQEQELQELARAQRDTGRQLALVQGNLDSLEAKKSQIGASLEALPQTSLQDLEETNQRLLQLSQEVKEAEDQLENARTAERLREKILLQQELARTSTARAQELQQELHGQKRRLEEQREKNYAQLLATSLQPGKPCPVCGSTTHQHSPQLPLALEEPEDGALARQSQLVQELEAQQETAAQEATRQTTILQQLEQQLGSLPSTAPLAELEALRTGLLEQKVGTEKEKKALHKGIASREGLEKELKAALSRQEPLQQESNSLQQRLASLKSQISEKEDHLQQTLQAAGEAGFQGATAKEVQSAANRWLEQTRTAIDSHKGQLERVQQDLSGERARCQEQEGRTSQCRADAAECEAELEKSLQAAGFSSVREVEEAHLSPTEIQDLQEAVEQWQQDFTRLSTQVQDSEKKLTGTLHETEEQITVLQEKKRGIEQEWRELEAAFSVALQQCQSTKSTITRWKDLEERRKESSAAWTLCHQLFIDISDKNPRKLALTTWILSVYLDQIVSCANGRLMRISEGRYSLHFAQDTAGNGAKGLDLEVLDSYTGRRRPCATLSGGETFMVSISLALALTDVVSSRRGGISLQSLFIDEGFGSLDPATLDKAMSILEEVREGRMVGVISHVQEMQGRIPSRLEVIKTPTGSSLQVVGD